MFATLKVGGQSVGNYSVSRSTGITYNSIESTGSSIGSWRYSGAFSQDDNRSEFTDIGFDFWYDGTRYTQFCVSTNGFIDFSSSTDDGGPQADDFGYNNTAFTQTNVNNATRPALAPFYDDQTAQGGTEALGNSIKYQVDGTAPNRCLTVEWINMAVYLNTTPDLNYQVKIYENTGVIEFHYGTMVSGTHSFSYTCGINAPTMSGPPTAAQLLTQQTANSTTFNNTVQNNLNAMPATDSKITFTPLTPANPSGSLTFSSVAQTSMQLNWTDWATNEVGYVVYKSTDGTNYFYETQTAANATNTTITGLNPSTTYYWKVHAVTEGRLSTALSASQATTAAGNKVSTGSGNWNNNGSWSPSGTPGAGDNVTIVSGHTITMNTTSASCNNLTINGTLQMGNNTTSRTLTVGNDVYVSSMGTFQANTGSNTTHIINMTFGNFQNDGTVNFTPDADSFCNLTFSKNGNQTLSGTGAANNFKNIILNMGTSRDNIMEVTASNFTASSDFITLTNGTFKLSSTNTTTLVASSGTFTLGSSSGFWLNNSNATVDFQNTVTTGGLLRTTNGTINVGNGANQSLNLDGGTIYVDGGNLNIAGRYRTPNINTTSEFILEGGILTVPTVSSTSTTEAPFTVNSAGSSFEMSGGTLVIEREGGSGAQNLGIDISNGIFDVTGGTVQIGNASTPAGQTIEVSSVISLPNFTVNSANATADLLSDLTVFNNVNISSGSLNCNTFTLSVGQHWTNAGTFNSGTGTVVFNGAGSQIITKSGGETFNNFTINKSGGTLTLNNNATVNSTFTLTAGTINVGSNTLTLGTSTGSIGTLNYTAGRIVGKFKRWLNATGVQYTFPLGITSDNRTAKITFNALTSGSITAEFVSTNPGNTGLPLSEASLSLANQYTEGYWDLVAGDGLVSSDYDVELTGDGFTSYSVAPSTRLAFRANSGNPWSLSGTHVDVSGNTAFRDNIAGGLSAQFCFLKPACTPYNVASISGSNSVCINTSGEPYSVTNTAGNIFQWSAVLGTQVGSGTANSESIDWGGMGGNGLVQVIEQNDCGDDNSPVTLSVTVHPVATSSITGSNNVAQFTNGHIYSVIETAGYTYTWNVVGGTLVSGQGTDSIVVNWGAAGAGSVGVTTTRLCAGTDNVSLPVTIVTPIVSSTSGNWTSGSTWVGGIAPTSSNFVEIASGHTVTMNGHSGACEQLTIKGTANWTSAFTTNVGASGVDITSTGDITGTVAGTLTTTGGLTLNVTLTSSSVGIVLQTTSGQEINGTGSLAKLTINANTTNKGNLTITNTLAGSATLTNDVGATLDLNAPSFTLSSLVASASNNSVNYGSSGAQSVRGITYHNLSVLGSGTKTLAGNAIVNGNFVNNGVTLDVSSSNYSITVGGNWTSSGVFTSRFGTVTFNGSSTQTIANSAGLVFNNITSSGSGTKTISNTLTINGDFTNSAVFSIPTSTTDIKGNWSNSGTYTAGTGTVTFNGSLAQTISGSSPTTFNNLTINNSAGVTLNSNQNISNTLTLTNGTFTTTGHVFTLLSDATKTARIAEITGGSIVGNITAQRYISGTEGWKMLASPVSGSTLTDWENEFLMVGFTGAYCTSCNPSVFTYDESVAGTSDNGYVAASSTADAITNGVGYFTWVEQAFSYTFPLTLDITGTPNTGATIINANYTDDAGQPDSEDGWNFIGNPYPSDVLWDAVSLSANVTPFAYIWDEATSSYKIYDQSSGKTIASHQGFFVKASTGSGTVTFNENDKSAEIDPFYKQAKKTDRVFIKLAGIGYESIAEIRFNNNATVNYDNQYDAVLLESNNANVANISTLSTDSFDLAINTMNYGIQDIVIPMKVVWTWPSTKTNTYTLTFDNIQNLANSPCLVLEDLVTGKSVNLNETTSYQFQAKPDTAQPARFLLHISGKPNIQTFDASCNTISDGTIIVESVNSSQWNIQLKSLEGKLYANTDKQGDNLVYGNLFENEYIVNKNSSSTNCSYSDTISLASNKTVIASFMLDNVEAKPKEILFFTNQSQGANNYMWEMGDGTQLTSPNPSHTYELAGDYEVQLIASKGTCSDTVSQVVIVKSILVGNKETVSLDESFYVYSIDNGIVLTNKQDIIDDITIELYNASGQLVFSKKTSQNNSIFIPIRTKGIYIANIRWNKKTIPLKVIY